MKKYLFGLIGLLLTSNAVAHGMSASAMVK